jgi:Tfp pilus assembly protein PilV
MLNLLAKQLSACRSSVMRTRSHSHRAAARPAAAPRRPGAGSQDGFLLVEVIISALLVGLIVIATLTGFDVTNRVTAEQRHRNQAAVLAAESQEQLRSDPASTLNELQITAHEYKRTVDKTEYTIKQEAGFVNDKEPGVSCEASNVKKSSQNGSYLRITSTVTWAQQIANKRPAVTQSSIITPPVGSALEVDVGNLPTPTAGVSGITAIVQYTPVKGSTAASLEATTGAAGCVIFGAIPSTEATLEILEKIGYVTPTGAVKWPTKEVSIAPNLTTHEQVTLNEGGSIKAEFTYEGSATANVRKEGTETVKGETFVAFNASSKGSEFQVGSTGFEYEAGGEEKYATKTGTYDITAQTAGVGGATVKYPRGDLFPFTNKWAVYAGDCTSNNTGKAAEAAGPVVEPGKQSTVKVPMSYVNLSVWTGSGPTNKGSVENKAPTAAIIDTACASAATPNNAWGTNYLHAQKLNAASHLSNPFQPFGAASLCIANAGTKHTYTASYSNTTAAGTMLNMYLGQRTNAELAAQKTEEATAKAAREKAEAEAKPAKEKREKEETEAKTAKTAREKAETEAIAAKTAREKAETEAIAAEVKREKEETEAAAAKKARETKEKEEREKWKAEETAKKITKKQREEKEKAQETARKATETTEKAAKTKREKEQSEAETAKTKRVKEEAEAETAKTKRVKEEAEAETAKTKRVKEEAEAGPAKEKRIAEEAAATVTNKTREQEEADAKTLSGITVASGKSEC